MQSTDYPLIPQTFSTTDMATDTPHISQESDTEVERNSLCKTTEVNNEPITSDQMLHHIIPNRRKRIRISPLSRSGTVLKNDAFSALNGSTEGVNSETGHGSTVEFPSSNHFGPSEHERTDSQRNSILNLTAIDPEVRGIIFKYVQCESVIHCLELAGFSSPYVLACLDETQVHRVEDFVGHACTLMNSVTLRERFIGPIFSEFPEQFRFPSGTVCGLLLAIAEIKRRYSSLNTPNESSAMERNKQKINSVSVQTDISVCVATPSLSTESALPYVGGISKTVIKSTSPVRGSVSPHPLVPVSSTIGDLPITVDTLSKSNLDDVTTSSNPVRMMAAAFQAAAVAAAGSNQALPTNLQSKSTTPELPTTVVGDQLSNHLELAQAFSSQFPVEITTSAARLVAAVSGCAFSNSFQPNQTTLGSGISYDEEIVDLDRLKQHSSASAIRLASRQFLNAHLVRGRDFDMEMEISTTPEGVKRVTGIFYCHLCREKRERTSAVRFSIARNRYPVLSNVLSHLKTHFHYRGQFFTGTGTTLTGVPSNMHHMNPPTKLPTGFGDVILPAVNPSVAGLPFAGSTVALPNFGSNTPGYFDANVTPSSSANIHIPNSTALTPTPPESNLQSFMIKGEELDSVTDDERKRQFLQSNNQICHSTCNPQANHSGTDTTNIESSDNIPTTTFNQIVDHFSSQADLAPLTSSR